MYGDIRLHVAVLARSYTSSSRQSLLFDISLHSVESSSLRSSSPPSPLYFHSHCPPSYVVFFSSHHMLIPLHSHSFQDFLCDFSKLIYIYYSKCPNVHHIINICIFWGTDILTFDLRANTQFIFKTCGCWFIITLAGHPLRGWPARLRGHKGSGLWKVWTVPSPPLPSPALTCPPLPSLPPACQI